MYPVSTEHPNCFGWNQRLHTTHKYIYPANLHIYWINSKHVCTYVQQQTYLHKINWRILPHRALQLDTADFFWQDIYSKQNQKSCSEFCCSSRWRQMWMYLLKNHSNNRLLLWFSFGNLLRQHQIGNNLLIWWLCNVHFTWIRHGTCDVCARWHLEIIIAMNNRQQTKFTFQCLQRCG